MLDELFVVKLSGKSFRYIKRIKAIATYLSAVAFIISALALVNYIPFLEEVFENEFGHSLIRRLQFYTSLAYTIIFALLFPLQAYSFYRFSFLFSMAVRNEGDEASDKCIKWLYRHVVVCIFTFTLNFLAFTIQFYLEHSW